MGKYLDMARGRFSSSADDRKKNSTHPQKELKKPQKGGAEPVRKPFRLPAGTSADTVEAWEERAAILEYDAGLSRDDAEYQAWEMVTRPAPEPPSVPPAGLEGMALVDWWLHEAVRRLHPEWN